MKTIFKMFLGYFFQEPYHILKLYPIIMITYEKPPHQRQNVEKFTGKNEDGVPVFQNH